METEKAGAAMSKNFKSSPRDDRIKHQKGIEKAKKQDSYKKKDKNAVAYLRSTISHFYFALLFSCQKLLLKALAGGTCFAGGTYLAQFAPGNSF